MYFNFTISRHNVTNDVSMIQSAEFVEF